MNEKFVFLSLIYLCLLLFCVIVVLIYVLFSVGNFSCLVRDVVSRVPRADYDEVLYAVQPRRVTTKNALAIWKTRVNLLLFFSSSLSS